MNSPQQDASRLRSPAWVALPDDDDDEAVQVGREASSISSTVWWLGTTMVMLAAMLLHAENHAPWWLVAITAAEAYASFRRVILLTGRGTFGGSSSQQQQQTPKAKPTRVRHFTSLRLAEGAPIDEIVARFVALDSMSEVRSVEIGSNRSAERKSREHTLGLMVTFSGHSERASYLRSAERAEFTSFAAPFVDEWFVFDFESGGVM
jgi:hypothetical protein